MNHLNKHSETFIALLLWIFILWFGAIFVKAIILKTTYIDVFTDMQDERLIKEKSFFAPKGDIYSYNNTTGDLLLLASNEIRYDIYLDLGRGRVNAVGEKEKKDWIISEQLWNNKLDTLTMILADRFKTKNKKEWHNYLLANRKKENRATLIAKLASQEDLDTLKHFKMTHKAVVADLKYQRIHPYNDMARRTIGIEYIDNGKEQFNGIEGKYASILQGSKGKRLERKIAPDLWIPVNSDLSIKPKNGKDIVTTLDIPLQELAENALKKCLDSNDAQSGTVILMETTTGYIKALASFTRKGEHLYYEDMNIAVGSTYEPGSTFKTATAMMLLDKGLVDTSQMVPTGMKEFTSASKPIYDVNKKGPDKQVSFSRAMEISSNVGISSVVFDNYGQNAKKREQFAKDLSQYFNYTKLDCDILVHEPMPKIGSSTYTDDLLHMSFGYVTSMTPLQLLTFYNGIANNGTVLKPIFVKEIMQDGKVIKTFEPVVLKKQMCRTETLKQIQDILRRVVLNGTGRRLKSASYGIAGKSGTAEVNYAKGNVDSKYRLHRASFVGYFPADSPQYSCIVVISEPKGGITHGGDLAAPVFREISDRVMGVNAQKTQSNLNSNSTNLSFNSTNQRFNKENHYIDKTKHISDVLKSNTVPDVCNWNISDAIYVLEKLGLKVTFSGYGKVVSQSIKPNSHIEKGKQIKLTLQHQ